MYGDLLYTPVHSKYNAPKQHTKGKSLAYSQLNKSASAYKSTEIGSHSPYRSTALSRLEDAKRNIDSVIVDLEQKRDMNDEAISQIRSVNSDVLDEFRRMHSVYEKDGASTYAPGTRSHRGSHDYRVLAPQDDINTRAQLNEEMKRNNELMLRISRLEQENKSLRRDYQMSFGPQNSTAQLQAQNDRLRQALASSSRLPQQIFAELEQLKRENDYLRKDTVKLLRKVGGIV